MTAISRGTLCFAVVLFALPARALDPAGGPPEPEERAVANDADHDSATNPATTSRAKLEAPDASVEDRTWLTHDSPAPTEVGSGIAAPNPLLTVLALLIVLGLGGGALWLQRRKRPLAQLGSTDGRLNLISSTRVGPKAFAVSAEVGGRVLLLGVTDHSVTHLGWLDPPELEAAEPEAAALSSRDELPDDYPGSALRAAANGSSPLTSSGNLRRFQEVLRGALPDREPSVRPAPFATPRSEPILRSSALGGGSDAASTLAALTEDVLGAASELPHGVPASLRRKRQRRQDQLEARAATPSAPPVRAPSLRPPAPQEPAPRPDAGLEGQVAGLRALRNG
jgi:flagellar biogenesis protein FliO